MFVSPFGGSRATRRGADAALDRELAGILRGHRFTGRIEEQLEERLGRKVDAARSDLGRLLFFDRLIGIKFDNTCAGCHSPTNGFGDSQPIAIGIENNNLVGPHRAGPRNMRRTPMVLNNAFYPKLMWNSRFVALSGDPFDNSDGFSFPDPEGLTISGKPHLLVAQAFIPPTERNEMAGFEFEGNNDDIRAEVVRRLNATPTTATLPRVYAALPADPIAYDHYAAPSRNSSSRSRSPTRPSTSSARRRGAMTAAESAALLFFGKTARDATRSRRSNEMFSDFTPRAIGVTIAPKTNSTFDGAQMRLRWSRSRASADQYKFRTSPLRNVALARVLPQRRSRNWRTRSRTSTANVRRNSPSAGSPPA